MSLMKKLFAAASTVAMLAAGLATPATALAVAHGPGSLLKTPDGTVWFVTNDSPNQRRAFTSGGAFMSYGFTFAEVVDANADDLALTAGAFVAPRDGSIFCATVTKGTDVAGECALITGGMKAAFTSAAVFTAQGHSFSRAHYGDSSFLAKTSNVDNGAAQHRMGTLINNGGTVQLVGTNSLLGIPSIEVFNSWRYSFADVVPANAADVTLPQNGVMCARVPGQLNPSFTGSCAQVPPPPVSEADCDDLQGNAGDVTIDQDNTFSTEEVGEGEEEVGVLGFEVEADDDSDVAVTSVKVLFFQSDTDVSQDLEDYVSEVQIMHGDDVVGTADADEFTEDSDVFTKSISLDCAAVAAGETGDFSVAVTAQENLDSLDIADENWNVSLQQIRFEDGDGVTTTEEVSDDDTTFNEAGEIDEAPDFVDFSTAADVELNTSLNDDEDDINEAHNVIVEDDEDTDDEPILAFTLEAEGDSDILVKDIPVLLTTSDADIATVISSADLYHGTTLVGSENVDAGATTDTVTFDDVDVDINAGDMEEFTVKVNILELEGNYAQGTTLNAQVTVASIDADDEQGDELTGGELTGSAVGENASLFSNGITVDVVSAETDIIETDAALGDIAQFTWELEITNVGDDDVYINADHADIVDASTAADVDQVYEIEESGTNVLATVSGTINSDEDDIAADASAFGGDYSGETFFRLDSGETITVEIVISGTNTVAAGQVRAFLEAIEWTTDDITCATACDATGETINSYTANLTEDSETPFRPIN